ncbi:MAG: ACT domain-containing protein [Oscillospiraceae bacterium]|nr:ACT domain-containing protein [Oscillospiraceae bacterium]
MNSSGFIVISRDVLPEIFTKVIEVKRLLACGEEKSSAAACKKIGVSRSAYYKYRDSVFTYEEKMTQKVISLYAVLRDEPGVLSSVLSELHRHGANVLTLNQSIPVDGAATVTFTVRLDENLCSVSEYSPMLSAVDGVVEVKLISGE